jgi:hypothetical protein
MMQTYRKGFSRINNVLSLSNVRFDVYLHLIHPNELKVHETATLEDLLPPLTFTLNSTIEEDKKQNCLFIYL